MSCLAWLSRFAPKIFLALCAAGMLVQEHAIITQYLEYPMSTNVLIEATGKSTELPNFSLALRARLVLEDAIERDAPFGEVCDSMEDTADAAHYGQVIP